MTVDFLSETMEIGRKCHKIFVLKEKSISNFISSENILEESGRLREVIASITSLKELLKEVLQTEEK